jgi:hypothetical protein
VTGLDDVRDRCPHCTETHPRNRLDQHITTAHADLPPCTATFTYPRSNVEHCSAGSDVVHRCAFRVGHRDGEYGDWHATARTSAGRTVWNDGATGATPHQEPKPEPATITDPAWFRQQITEAVHETILRATDLLNFDSQIADAVLAVRDRHLEQLRQRLALADTFQTAKQRYATEQGEPPASVVEALGYHAMGQGIDLERAEQQRDQLAALAREFLYGDQITGDRITRWREQLDEISEQTDGHRYLSTGCLHGQHDYCQNHAGLSGAKTPAQCKFCAAPCVCPCHKDQP